MGEGLRFNILARLLPRLEDMIFIAVFLAVIGLGPRLLNVDGDLGRHLTIGGHILDSRSIPTRDLFSHTLAGEPLTPHEWLSQVGYALAYRLMGLDGVVLLCASLIAATFALLCRVAVRRSGLRLVSLALVILAAAAASLHWLARPHLFTLLMAVVWTDRLERLWRGESKRWWTLPLIMLAWANLHGAFIAGFVIGVVYLVSYVWRRRFPDPDRPRVPGVGRHLALAGAASAVVTLVNPAGFELWTTSFGFIGNRYLVGHTAEYLPPNFQSASAWPFLLMMVFSIALLASSRMRVSLPSTLLLAVWTAFGLYSVRNVPLYALVATPILAEVAAIELRASRRLSRLESTLAKVEASLRGRAWPVVTVIVVAAMLAGGARLDFARSGNRFDPAVFPVQAVDWLEAHPQPGRMFNNFMWGGYLLYRLWPEQTVFIDGQTDFYGEALTRQYECVITLADGWHEVLDQYDVAWALMPASSALARALSADPGWQVVYEDATAVIVSQMNANERGSQPSSTHSAMKTCND